MIVQSAFGDVYYYWQKGCVCFKLLWTILPRRKHILISNNNKSLARKWSGRKYITDNKTEILRLAKGKKHVSRFHVINAVPISRSTSVSPFKTRRKEDVGIFKILQDIEQEMFEEEREALRYEARQMVTKKECKEIWSR